MKIYDDIGISIPEIHLPKPGIDLKKWAVIACDQFTSEPDYWRKVEQEVGDAPSTLNLVFPEIHLGAEDKLERIQNIQATMRKYLTENFLRSHEGMVFVERRVAGKTRRGLLFCLDLEHYDYKAGSTSLIRATEGTIVDRLPPRISIREGAALELPHILVLIDDPQRTVIEPLAAESGMRPPLYDFELMLDGGHLTGFSVSQASQDRAVAALKNLGSAPVFQDKYDLKPDVPVLLFAVGDGNHSLATAKAIWQKIRPGVRMDHPARYALVEVENLHDPGLEFEAIHRVLFSLKGDIVTGLEAKHAAEFHYIPVPDVQEMVRRVDSQGGLTHVVGVMRGDKNGEIGVMEISHPTSNLPVGTVQSFLDEFMQNGGAQSIDYVHGLDTLTSLSLQPGNAGIYLPRIRKSSLFKTVLLDGVLPRKSFSLGEAREKRYYMEARRIG